MYIVLKNQENTTFKPHNNIMICDQQYWSNIGDNLSSSNSTCVDLLNPLVEEHLTSMHSHIPEELLKGTRVLKKNRFFRRTRFWAEPQPFRRNLLGSLVSQPCRKRRTLCSRLVPLSDFTVSGKTYIRRPPPTHTHTPPHPTGSVKSYLKRQL